VSRFKDMVAADLGKFIDPDIFGESHRIEGAEVMIVPDDDALKEKQANLVLSESTLLFYAKAADLPPRKNTDSLLNFDGREYIVDDWSEDAGMATIAMHQNRSG